MDREFRNTLQRIVNLSDEAKVNMAMDAFREILPALRRFDAEHRGVYLMCTVFGTSAAADGKLSAAEFALISGMMKIETGVELEYDKVLGLVKSAANQYRLMQQLSEVLTKDERTNLLLLVSAICSIDDTISKEEIDFIESLF